MGNCFARPAAPGKYISDDDDLCRILEGCDSLRPQMRRTWSEIYDIPLTECGTAVKTHTTVSGEEQLIPNLVAFSFEENKNVPLLEELSAKGWQLRQNRQVFSNYLNCDMMRKLCTTFRADPVKLVKGFVRKRPRVLFAGILSCILTGEEIEAVLKADGDKFIYHTRHDQMRGFYGGASALIYMIQENAEPLPETLIRALVEAGGEDSTNAQDNQGRTVIHFCAALNYYDQLRSILPFSPKLDVTDKLGNTALDLAVARGYKGIEALLNGPSIPSEGAEFLRTSLSKKGLLDFLPPLYEPSRDIVDGEVNKAVLRYMEHEFPDIMRQGASLVIIPNEFPAECPFSEKARKLGWKNEKLVRENIKSALEALCKIYLDQKFIFCSGCRYAVTSMDQDGRNQKPLEREIDGLIVTHGKFTGGIVQEVKGGTSGRDFLRRTGPKQLENHIAFLQDKLTCDLGFMKKCLVTPEYPAQLNDTSSEAKFIDSLAFRGIVGLNRRTLGDVKTLCQWLELNLGLQGDQSQPKKGDDYVKVLAWALVATMGVVVPNIGQNMDDITSKSVTAMLTTVQYEALHLTASASGVPTVIFGGFGTGKSFLAEQKILSLHKQGQINNESKLIFYCHHNNKAFNAVMRGRIKRLEGVRFEEPHTDMAGMTYALVNMNTFWGKGTPGNWKARYLIIDQCENFLVTPMRSQQVEMVSNFWEAIIKLSKRMDLVWIMMNPHGSNRVGTVMKFKELVERDCAHQSRIITLGKTFRNTQSVFRFTESMDNQLRNNKQLELGQPCGVRGPPVQCATYNHICRSEHPRVENQCIVELECMASTAARVLHDHILEKNIDSKDIIIIIHDIYLLRESKIYHQFLAQLDRALVQEFQSVKKERLLSMAPVLIHNPMELLSGIRPDPEFPHAHLILFKEMKHAMDGGGTEHVYDAFEKLMTTSVHIFRGTASILETVVFGILLRLLTLRESKAASENDVSNVLGYFEDAVRNRNPNKLKEFLDCYRFVGIHYWGFVDGYESNVVVAMARETPHALAILRKSLSRAKVMGTLVASSRTLISFKEKFPDLHHDFNG